MTDPVFMRRMNRMVTAPKRPAWLKRALNPNTPTTVAKESIRTASSGVGEGREILYPTIRMVGGELIKYSREEARKIALRKNTKRSLKSLLMLLILSLTQISF